MKINIMKNILFGVLLVPVVFLNTQESNDKKSICVPMKGSTPELESVFMGKCNSFVNSQKANCNVQSKPWDCVAIWNQFKKTIVNKNPCQVTVESFEQVIRLASHTINSDSMIFWSGTKRLAQESKSSSISLIS